MQAAALLQYPEFVLAGLFSVLALIFGIADEGDVHFPGVLAEAAKTCFFLLPRPYRASLNRLLIQADWRSNLSFGDFAALKIFLPLLSLAVAAFLPLYAAMLAAVILFFAPDLLITILARRRQRAILDSLPQALDLMVLCVDAGLGLDATLHRIASEKTALATALNDELQILGRDLLLGMDRERAYQELYNRTGVDELKTLGSALYQATKLGLSIARILRAQSEFIRKKQSQKAEEKALKMPIYMVFPMWFCIMPSLLVVVLGPSLLRFFQQLHVLNHG